MNNTWVLLGVGHVIYHPNRDTFQSKREFSLQSSPINQAIPGKWSHAGHSYWGWYQVCFAWGKTRRPTVNVYLCGRCGRKCFLYLHSLALPGSSKRVDSAVSSFCSWKLNLKRLGLCSGSCSSKYELDLSLGCWRGHLLDSHTVVAKFFFLIVYWCIYFLIRFPSDYFHLILWLHLGL